MEKLFKVIRTVAEAEEFQAELEKALEREQKRASTRTLSVEDLTPWGGKLEALPELKSWGLRTDYGGDVAKAYAKMWAAWATYGAVAWLRRKEELFPLAVAVAISRDKLGYGRPDKYILGTVERAVVSALREHLAQSDELREPIDTKSKGLLEFRRKAFDPGLLYLEVRFGDIWLPLKRGVDLRHSDETIAKKIQAHYPTVFQKKLLLQALRGSADSQALYQAFEDAFYQA